MGGKQRGEGGEAGRQGHATGCLSAFTPIAEASPHLPVWWPPRPPTAALTLGPGPPHPQEHLNYVTEIAQDEIYILDPELLGASARPDLPTPTSPLPTSPCSPTPR